MRRVLRRIIAASLGLAIVVETTTAEASFPAIFSSAAVPFVSGPFAQAALMPRARWVMHFPGTLPSFSDLGWEPAFAGGFRKRPIHVFFNDSAGKAGQELFTYDDGTLATIDSLGDLVHDVSTPGLTILLRLDGLRKAPGLPDSLVTDIDGHYRAIAAQQKKGGDLREVFDNPRLALRWVDFTRASAELSGLAPGWKTVSNELGAWLEAHRAELIAANVSEEGIEAIQEQLVKISDVLRSKPSFEVFDVLGYLRKFTRGKNLSIPPEYEGALLTNGDRPILSRLIRNLLNNAADVNNLYQAPGDRYESLPDVRLSVTSDSQNVFIHVHDSGNGMTEQQLAKVRGILAGTEVERFTTNDRGQTMRRGRGMRIVRRLAAQLNAAVTVESRPQSRTLPGAERREVSTFTIRLPRAPGEEAPLVFDDATLLRIQEFGDLAHDLSNPALALHGVFSEILMSPGLPTAFFADIRSSMDLIESSFDNVDRLRGVFNDPQKSLAPDEFRSAMSELDEFVPGWIAIVDPIKGWFETNRPQLVAAGVEEDLVSGVEQSLARMEEFIKPEVHFGAVDLIAYLTQPKPGWGRLFSPRPDAPVWVQVDQALLTRILANLVNNARDVNNRYRPPGEGITFEPRVRISLSREAGAVLLQVHDTGNGMSPESLANVRSVLAGTATQRFSTKDRGEGMRRGRGLRIIRHLAAQLHASVTVESHPQSPTLPKEQREEVTTFTLRFPLSAPPSDGTNDSNGPITITPPASLIDSVVNYFQRFSAAFHTFLPAKVSHLDAFHRSA